VPIYTYHCNACHAEFDQLVRSETKVACPACDGRKLERLMPLTARPASGGKQPDSFGKLRTSVGRLGPPPGGGCCGGGCHTHNH
jgi:putative FmdB family regulatory protein